MSRRARTIIVIDLAVLIALAVVGAWFVLERHRDSTPDTTATGPTQTAPIAGSLLQSAGATWILAACQPGFVFETLPAKPLPGATQWAMCAARNDPTSSMLIGVYDDENALDRDIARRAAPHPYATRADENDQVWLFLMEQPNAVALAPLDRYDFTLHDPTQP